MLITYALSTREVLQVSANCHVALQRPPEECLGVPLHELFPAEAAAQLLAPERREGGSAPLTLDLPTGTWEAVTHQAGRAGVLELEPPQPSGSRGYLEQQHLLSHTLDALHRATNLADLTDATARAVARLTGFDRVMVYQFDADWHGEVVAEVKVPELDSLFGLHFPADDIPAQARRLYERNWLRLIADVSYTPVPLVPVLNPLSGQPLDLSHSVLRSVSPVHLEYLRNMGVGCSMSVSLLREGRLWGLIACHHQEPRYLSATTRVACQLVGQIASMQISAMEAATLEAARRRAGEIQATFFEHLARSDRFVDALERFTPELLRVLNAKGSAVVLHDRTICLGECPPQETVQKIAATLRKDVTEPLFATRSLMQLDSNFAGVKEVASGLLAVALSPLRTDYLFWFRPEAVSTVTWAGNPQKAMYEGALTMHPRKSFSAWKEQVFGESTPWLEHEREVALELRAAINANMFKRYDNLRRWNAELEQKNNDLDSFAYIASHDLKEPLRGMRNYAQFLLEDNEEVLDEASRSKLKTIMTLGDRLRDQLEALLHFSRLGRKALKSKVVAANRVVTEAVELLQDRIAQERAVIQVDPALPNVAAEPSLLREVFMNLISNGLKYNTAAEKIIEVGVLVPSPEGQTTFFVRDNGIGIAKEQQPEVFRIFRRLHARDDYGGGTGAGLAIVKSVVERHGGTVWVLSTPGQGSTFCFSLPEQPEEPEAASFENARAVKI